ncbi:MAG: hypothetical protein HOF35_08880 [Bacteroidetes bacterium]|jgi:hypothetical protein|nr:hypothetical protein [Bacteroidota bacterium]
MSQEMAKREFFKELLQNHNKWNELVKEIINVAKNGGLSIYKIDNFIDVSIPFINKEKGLRKGQFHKQPAVTAAGLVAVFIVLVDTHISEYSQYPTNHIEYLVLLNKVIDLRLDLNGDLTNKFKLFSETIEEYAHM